MQKNHPKKTDHCSFTLNSCRQSFSSYARMHIPNILPILYYARAMYFKNIGEKRSLIRSIHLRTHIRFMLSIAHGSNSGSIVSVADVSSRRSCACGMRERMELSTVAAAQTSLLFHINIYGQRVDRVE